MNKLKSYSVCSGNPDGENHNLIPIGAGLSDNKSQIWLIGKETSAQKGNWYYSSMIRSIRSSYLVFGNRWFPCSKYRDNLIRRKQRMDEKKSSPAPNYVNSSQKYVSHFNMDRSGLIEKVKQQSTGI
ncbi:hypothetical protein KUTeg_001403 [Tegillarca granosa]|uniref:Uncharacterized protein n=1 Tax=Tegillarca granosa TaxID=220873 RepID=A0ABQ9FSU1_TEGGR|nr:hypothetical protein KUTeg_001403 [Tegillarca granosa]